MLASIIGGVAGYFGGWCDHIVTRAIDLTLSLPWLFVLIWSTGFIVARFGMPHAPPMKFLELRYALSVVCFAAWAMNATAGAPSAILV